jgi:DNA-binding response OmpR family regulator
MHILLISDSKVNRAMMAKLLVEHAHVVDVAESREAARARLDERRCEVAIIDWGATRPSALDLLLELRAEEGDGHVYTIVVMTDPSASSVSAAFAGGVDDILRRPFLREELVGRVGAVERIRRWAAKVLVQVENLAANVSTLRTWVSADRCIGQDLGELLSQKLEVRRGGRRAEPMALLAELPIAMVEAGVQCRLRVAIDHLSLRSIALGLLGREDAPPEELADVVRELANVAGGAFVSSADAEGVALTIGLPVILDAPSAGQLTGTVQEFVLGVVDSPVELSICLAVQSRELRNLTAKQLREGMVVARDIVGNGGGVLLTAGTRLTESSVTRLAEILLPKTTVIVLAA